MEGSPELTEHGPVLEPSPIPDLAAAKVRSHAVWRAGDYAVIGTTLQLVGELLAEAADVRAGERVLDVACGNGNAALAAARRFALITAADFVPALLGHAQARSLAEGLALDLHEADAEALPRTAPSTWSSRPSVSCSPPTRSVPPPSCSGPWAATFPLRPGLPLPPAGAPGPGWRACSRTRCGG